MNRRTNEQGHQSFAVVRERREEKREWKRGEQRRDYANKERKGLPCPDRTLPYKTLIEDRFPLIEQFPSIWHHPSRARRVEMGKISG